MERNSGPSKFQQSNVLINYGVGDYPENGLFVILEMNNPILLILFYTVI